MYLHGDIGGFSIEIEIEFCSEELADAECGDGSTHDREQSEFVPDGVVSMVGKGKVSQWANCNDCNFSGMRIDAFHKEVHSTLLYKFLFPSSFPLQLLHVAMLLQSNSVFAEVVVFVGRAHETFSGSCVGEGIPL